MSNAKHMVFIENKTCIACLTCCFDSESSFRDPLDGSLAVEKGDEEKMRTNIDQTNGMLTSSIALILTHNTSSSPKTYLHFLYNIPKIRKQFPNYQVLIFEQKDYCDYSLQKFGCQLRKETIFLEMQLKFCHVVIPIHILSKSFISLLSP